MDIEQLKLILDTIGAAGEGAFVLGLLWFLKPYFLGTLFTGVFLYSLSKVINALSNIHKAVAIINQIRRATGHRDYGEITSSEYIDIQKVIVLGLEAWEKSKEGNE